MQTNKWGVGRVLHGIAHRALKIQPIGLTFCSAAAALGFEFTSKRASKHAHYVPSMVQFDVLCADNVKRTAMMSSADGKDQIARVIWIRGLSAYEAPLPDLFMALVAGASTVFDVGANSGLYAIVAAVCEPKCKVFSFEPFPRALSLLNVNLRANKIEDRVTVINGAAGSASGDTQLFIPEKPDGDALETSASLVKTFREKHSAVLDVKVHTLDEIALQNNVASVDILRADVEGAEHMVLQGATRILKDHRPLCFIEVLADITATYLERIRSVIDYGVLALGHDTLTHLPQVKCVAGDNNQLWYPLEKFNRIAKAAEKLQLKIRN